MAASKPRRLVVEKNLADSPLCRSLKKQLPETDVRERIGPQDYPGFGAGDLILARHEGAFVKPCPGTKDYNCCGLQIIHFGLGCFLDCTYCILQSYLDTDALVLFGNVEDLLDQVRKMLDQPSPGRFCTGEFTDSLLLEEMTGLGAKLVNLFAGSEGHVLELKTKTVNIQGLLGLRHNGRTIIGFSVNAPAISKQEEIRAASLTRRLEAAAMAVDAGYRVSFHFDPMIRHAGWRDGYAETVHNIYRRVPADRIAWISMGGFRYLPRLKDVVRRRFPETRIMEEEFIAAPDGKMRYLRPLRVDMYRRLLGEIRRYDPEACVYMCMENPRVWREVFGFDPGGEGLIGLLDQRINPPGFTKKTI